MDFFHQWWGNLPESFFKQGVIGDFDHSFSGMSTQVCWALRRKYHGTQPGQTLQNLPALVAKIPICSDLTPQTVFPVLASKSALASGGLGPCLIPPSCQSTLMTMVHMWPQLLSLPGSLPSESRDTLYSFSLLQWYSCCHCASWCKHSVLSDLGVMTYFQHAGPVSSHLTPLLCKQSLHSHI